MTPELEFIKKNNIPLAAFCWEKTQKYGPGIVLVSSTDNRTELLYKPVSAIENPQLRELIWQCDFSKEILVAINSSQVLRFEPEPSPKRCYEIEFLENVYRQS